MSGKLEWTSARGDGFVIPFPRHRFRDLPVTKRLPARFDRYLKVFHVDVLHSSEPLVLTSL
ncbi:hypothetical protein RvY_09021 [Ramazzottius varieornatus]|uniref:Uncharacterized protein n=1 Tax=Ramazzottius varieornatus TaxID=947166 RepID=A0A1D1VAE0_RAMVA|nr:hypothetical protein RvY_09021 [Ramazzottius varieornatus]